MNSLHISVAAISGFALSLAVASNAAATKRQDEQAKEILSQFEKTGESVYCLSLAAVRSTKAVDDHAMIILAQGGKVYLSELHGRCIGLGREQRYIHDATTNKMCRGDTIRVVSNFGTPIGSCSFGNFEKLKEISQPE